jgi:hypothetical protein
MIEDFDDFCLYMYVIIDDIWKVIAPMSVDRKSPPKFDKV